MNAKRVTNTLPGCFALRLNHNPRNATVFGIGHAPGVAVPHQPINNAGHWRFRQHHALAQVRMRDARLAFVADATQRHPLRNCQVQSFCFTISTTLHDAGQQEDVTHHRRGKRGLFLLQIGRRRALHELTNRGVVRLCCACSFGSASFHGHLQNIGCTQRLCQKMFLQELI